MKADIKWLDNPEVFRVNQLPAHSDHAYYMDYESLERRDNGLTQVLNGEWNFCFSVNAKSRPQDFYEKDFSLNGFNKINVPGHIELAGYDQIRYINTMYPWEGKDYRRGAYSLDPENNGAGMFSEAEYNPVGSYITTFTLDRAMYGKRIHICFEGVEMAMYVWLNGNFVGYAEDSFTPSEFNLTPYISEGENTLAVEVHKMSSAAFLEDQDFFRFFGIFRNVSLKAILTSEAKACAFIDDVKFNYPSATETEYNQQSNSNTCSKIDLTNLVSTNLLQGEENVNASFEIIDFDNDFLDYLNIIVYVILF